MEEISPAVTLSLGLGNSICESPMEITYLKLVTGTAATILMSDPMSAADLNPEKHGAQSNCCSVEVIASPALIDSLQAVVEPEPEPEALGKRKSVNSSDCFPLWGCTSICGMRPEMEDEAVAVPQFFEIPLQMVTGDRSPIRLPAHFFGVYDGHGGFQVARYCKERIHLALVEELENLKESNEDGCQNQWERAFTKCFKKVDDEVGGKVNRGMMREENSGDACSIQLLEPVAPETVGSTAVAAVICSSHIVVANCGDSRAVLCRGKAPVVLSIDHKPVREDEYERIEAEGGKIIQWNGFRVFGVLAMSRAIGDRYMKPWIIPEPEVKIVPRSKDDDCLILASDGLWDVMSNEEACDAARRRIVLWHKKNGSSSDPATLKGEGANPAAQAAAEYLSKLALHKGSKDNISVVVVDLKANRKFKSKS